jgi:deoxyribodipyrimidine photo-lyase
MNRAKGKAPPPTIVHLGQDLRLADNPALRRAIARGGPVIPVFVWTGDGPWAPGSASRWWLHYSLQSLAADLARLGSRLVLRRGPEPEALAALARETRAAAVFWNRRYEPAARAAERELDRSLRAAGIDAESCPGNLLFEPGSILTAADRPFQVFTPFWKACLAAPPPAAPLPAPRRLPSPRRWPASLGLDELGLLPAVDWAAGLREAWRPGETGAARLLRSFLRTAAHDYAAGRDRPDQPGTSRLSPHLHFGEISARTLWHAAPQAEPWRRQLGWREFSAHLLYHFPHTAAEPLRPEFRFFPWRLDAAALEAWTRGCTGYPIVDAGMRQLWQTGWMHNRVRMLAASFLVKHLLVPWHEGAAWFWDTLVDADLANNTMGWQWTAGCGADAAPFFRIFNPVLQGEKFDPDGAFVRRWLPELRGLPNGFLHRPWEAPPAVLAEAGITLGTTYPVPIVGHAAARERALGALAEMQRFRRRPRTASARTPPR